VNTGTSASNAFSFNRSDAVTYTGTITGSGQVTHIGSGTTTLSAKSSYTGGTTISAGTLLLTGTSAAGSGFIHVDSAGTLRVNTGASAGVANAVSLRSASASYILDRATGQGFNAYSASSSLGGSNVTASLLAGTASAARTITTSMAATSLATNDNIRVSDVFNLQGTGTDIFVLQLQIADVVSGEYLGWLNGSNTWVNAVTGNSSTGANAVTNFAGSFASSGASATANYLGSWGYDATGETVWAVLDHNSGFAVIPEPQTWVLIGFGIAVVGWRVKTRRSQRA
jgi:autotransporter-associated beta strand protein